MKKICLVIFCFFLFANLTYARHIKGGWVQYEYISTGSAAGTSIYKIIVYVFRDCQQSGPMPGSLGIYDAVTYANVTTISGTANAYTLLSTPSKTSFDPCLSNPPTICYQIYTYTTTITLADNTNGYLIAIQDANRVTGIVNITNSSSTGISFIGSIPGKINGTDYHINNSPYFNFTDTAIICYNSRFSYQFSATDADKDTLTYSFGNGINGTQTLTAPPYSSVPYQSGFSGAYPLGSLVTIDSVTGLISGVAPSATGEYVIAVYVHEWRNGIIINSTKKELQITVGNCSLSAASLKPSYINCDNFIFSFENETTASNITAYVWDFGVTNSVTDVSTSPTPTYTYADTGTYTIKLIVSNTGGCTDSATAPVKVYPGFEPSFSVTGSCYQSPIQFTDASTTKYGSINSWLWDFGDSTTINDTATVKNITYQYPVPGNKTVSLLVTSTKGCSGSFSKTIAVNDKPAIYLPFTDTLICSVDSLPLKAQSNGSYSWSPNYNISNTTTLSPTVFPKDTTVYTLTVTDQGCVDSAKITVNVLTFISVKLPSDTGICKTDSFIIRPVSDALSYHWSASTNANSLSSTVVKYPVATPLVTTTYYVTANLGYCQDSTKIKVNVSPYPVAQAGSDTAICFGSRLQLSGNITGSSYTWSPATSLSGATTLSPVAGPSKTTSYILTARDTAYCIKEVSDTIIVRVVQPFTVNAGNDTTADVGEALQLTASGASLSYSYTWSPATYLSNAAIYNPVFTINTNTIDSIKYILQVTTPEGCTSSDDLVVKVYKGGPDILVPGAFTPNGDGKNDILRPILIGITKFDYFALYNRYGQMIYYTTERGAGWDGNFNGSKQGSGTFVYMTKGEDVKGNTIFRKGTCVLIR